MFNISCFYLISLKAYKIRLFITCSSASKKRLSNPLKTYISRIGLAGVWKRDEEINKNGDRSQRTLSLVLAVSLFLIRTFLELPCRLNTECMCLLLMLVRKMQKSDFQFTVCTKLYSMWEPCLHTGRCSCLEQGDFISRGFRLVASGLILLPIRIVNAAS